MKSVFIFHLLIIFTTADEEFLYKTPTSSDVPWNGWRTSNEAGKSKNGFVFENGAFNVCDVSVVGAVNYLRTRIIPVPDSVNIIKVTLRISVDDCKRIPNAQKSDCKNKLTFYLNAARENDEDFDFSSETKIHTFEWQEREEDNSLTLIVDLNSQKRRTGNILIGIKDQASCTAIKELTVSTRYCNNIVQNLAVFNKTYPVTSSYVSMRGHCVDHAVSSQPPKVYCTISGNMEIPKTAPATFCSCDKGYEVKKNFTECHACGYNHYKSEIGNTPCLQCPRNTKREDSPFSRPDICKCKNGYYRANPSDASSGCSLPPKKPVNVTVKVQKTTATVSWLPSHLVWYRIECDLCNSHGVSYSIDDLSHFVDNRVDFSELYLSTNYTLRIYAENAVSINKEVPPSVVMVVIPTPQRVRIPSIQVVQNKAGEATVSWKPPKMNSQFIPSKGFEYVLSVVTSEVTAGKYNTRQHSITVKGLLPNTYRFQVHVKDDETILSDSVEFSIKDYAFPFTLNPQKMGLTVGMLTCLTLLLLVLLLVTVYCYKRKLYKHPPNGLHLIEIGSKPDDSLNVPYGQAFVDPNYYENPEKILSEFTRELQLEQIEFIKDEHSESINFSADVVKGMVYFSEYEKSVVMIKRLSYERGSAFEKAFIVEAAICGQFNHPNVLMLHGVLSSAPQMLMCLEYTANGALDRALRESNGKYSTLQLVHLLRGIACGMHYLSDLGYVHKVLNAENVLMSSSGVCKVAGFDTRTALEYEETIGTSNLFIDLLPWASLEVMTYRKYSSAADVWAFGTLVWEVMSGGQRPFADWMADDIMKFSEAGHRLPSPSVCPLYLTELMRQCWTIERNYRPSFGQLREGLEKVIRSPGLLDVATGTAPPTKFSTLSMKPVSPIPPSLTIEEWLKSFKLQQYAQRFTDAHYTTLEDLFSVDNHVLVVLGISSAKHRRKILSNIELLRQRGIFTQYPKVANIGSIHNNPANVYI